MKIGKTREELVSSINVDVENLLGKNREIERIAGHISKVHGIPKKVTLSVINKTYNSEKLKLFELGLIGEQIALSIGLPNTWLDEFFNPSEIEDMRNYMRSEDYENLVFSFRPVIRISQNVYYLSMSFKDIAKMFDRGIFPWSEDVQREGERKVYNGKEIYIPKINQTNVIEISKQAGDGVLMENELAYNLIAGSSPTNRELYYDEATFTLSFSEEFSGQIIDGMHRTMGIHRAWLNNQDIKGSMPIRISNYTTKEAMRYQYELSKATPIDKARLQEMSHERMMDRVVDNLKIHGHLKGKISRTTIPNKNFNEMVSYKALSDGFYDFFEKDNSSANVVQVMNEFPEYLMYLFEYYAKDYMDSKDFNLFDNYNFYWHIYIFKFMLENKINYSDLNKVINLEYFNVKMNKMRYNRKDGSFNYVNATRRGREHFDEMLNKYKEDN